MCLVKCFVGVFFYFLYICDSTVVYCNVKVAVDSKALFSVEGNKRTVNSIESFTGIHNDDDQEACTYFSLMC